MLHDASTQHVSIVFWSRSFLGDPRCVPGAASNSINNAWKLCRRGSQLWKFAVQPTFNATLFGCRIHSRQTWHFGLKPKRTLKPRLLDVMSHIESKSFFSISFFTNVWHPISIDENHHSIRSKGFDSRQPSRQCRFPLFNLPKHRQLSEPKYVQLLAWQKLHFFHQKRRHSDVFSSSVEREIVGKW